MITTLQSTAVVTGCCEGNECPSAAGFGLPNSSRHEAATADTGFQSAMVCSQCGIPCVGTKQLDTNAIGNNTINPTACADSGSLTDRPMHAVNQLNAYAKNTATARPAMTPLIPLPGRHPIT